MSDRRVAEDAGCAVRARDDGGRRRPRPARGAPARRHPDPYDRLVLATGARANVPTLAGSRAGAAAPLRAPGGPLRPGDQGTSARSPRGVVALRDLADAEHVRAAVSAGSAHRRARRGSARYGARPRPPPKREPRWSSRITRRPHETGRSMRTADGARLRGERRGRRVDAPRARREHRAALRRPTVRLVRRTRLRRRQGARGRDLLVLSCGARSADGARVAADSPPRPACWSTGPRARGPTRTSSPSGDCAHVADPAR